jgi:membrane-associated protease RseP (regulator of RpoE activity)
MSDPGPGLSGPSGTTAVLADDPPPPPGPDAPAPGPSAAGALGRLAVVVALVVAIFMALHLGALLLVVAIIIATVLVHELGHLVAAKRSGMAATQYFVGFGPTLWSVRRGETEYGVKAIPAGGFVKIPGMTNLEEVDPELEPRTYRRQPFKNRILVASAGSLTHFAMAFVLAWVAVVAFGVPSSRGVQVAGFVSWPGHTQTAAQAGGVRSGDVIESVDGRTVTSADQLSRAIRSHAGRPVHLTVARGGRVLALTVVPALAHPTATGEALGPGPHQAGMIGIEETSPLSGEGPIRALGTAAIDVGRVTSATVTGLGHVFSPHGLSNFFSQVTNSQVAAKAAAHPQTSGRINSIVGATSIAVQAEHAGILYLLGVLIALNIAFGILNMLPMLPLDGGHVAIAIYERIRTRPGRPYYQADVAKMMPVVYAFVAFLAVIVVSAAFLDIAHPTANLFH